jgi:hypothetical protein
LKMNSFFYNFFTYFENVIDPAAGKSDVQKTKRKSTKGSAPSPASPDCLNIRAAVRSQNAVRRNPAP